MGSNKPIYFRFSGSLFAPFLNISLHPNGHSWKDNLIGDFYDNWSIEETCDKVTLESSHPLKPPNSIESSERMFYTHECKDDKIAYFKVDMNLIDITPNAYLGNVWKMNDLNYLWPTQI